MYADASPVSKKDPTGNFALTTVVATSIILNTISSQPVISVVPMTYVAGICKHPLWDFQRGITFDIFEHHNVKIAIRQGKNGTGQIISSFQRGLFADDPGYAVQQAILAEVPLSGVDGWVPGHIKQDANEGACDLKEVTAGKYKLIAYRIIVATDNRYNLRYWNCKHWAADKLK